MPDFEVILISIDWESTNKVRAIIPSKKIIEASKVVVNNYEYDIVIYNKEEGLYFQFAIKTKLTPFIKSNEDSWNSDTPLYNIQDDIWIFKGVWRMGQRKMGFHYCPSINTPGKIDIELRNAFQISYFITIDINSNIEDFDFHQLKNDFEGEFWNLITSNKSNVISVKNELRYSNKIFRYAENQSINKFIKAFDHIEKSPKRELSHTKELRRIEKVIPIVETYRKLSTVGLSTRLPSKAVIENHDIYENRFVCFMLHSIHLIVSKNIKYISLQIERFKNEIKTLTQTITILEDPFPKVNPIKVELQISFQEQQVLRLENYWMTINNSLTQYASETYSFISIKIKYSHSSKANTFWCSTNTTSFCLFRFPDSVIKYIKDGMEFQFEANFNQLDDVLVKSGKIYRSFAMTYVQKIVSVELISEQKILNKQRSNKDILEKNNWCQLSILTVHEQNKFQTERNNQVQTLGKKLEKINFQIKNTEEFKEEQTLLRQILEQKLKTNFFIKTMWKNFQDFKPSMTFIQNIAYRNALRYYKEILKLEGIDIELCDLYEKVTAYGLREIPQMYELWCLVTLIKVLEENFHFKHDKNDMVHLLKNIDPKNQIISKYSKIAFANSLAGRKVILHYQKRTLDNKRPDFILEITSSKRTINLVLDSKFKNYNYKKSIISETIEMNNKYGENENYVFILHPCKDGTFKGRNIKYTNHGGEKIYCDEAEKPKFPSHYYGYIELKPNITDNLKKLIAMSFEYLLEPSSVAEDKNPIPENKMFCINCGNEKFVIEDGFYKSGGKYYKYSCIAEDNNNNKLCGHEVNISYCWNCKTKLFKHGSYWDYHLESTWSISDIHCPHCGMTIADRP
jgi:hypothetical protein